MPPRFAALVAISIVATACASRGDPAPGGSATAGICEAIEEASAGDLTGARKSFLDVHAELHAIADRLANDGDAGHRARAADLLRAKQGVEAGLDRAQHAGLADRLRELAKATAAAESIDSAEPCG